METTFTYDHYVTGKNFVGRKSEKELLENTLASGMNVTIYEPPKTGKTSLLRETFLGMKTGVLGALSTVDLSLLSVRCERDFAVRLASAVIRLYASTPDEIEAMCAKYLGGTGIRFDRDSYAAGGEFLSVNSGQSGLLPDADLRAVMTLPYRVAEDRHEKLYFALFEFQNILLFDDPDHTLQLFEETVRKATPRQKSHCAWVWIGSMVNAMKVIFEHRRYFYRMVERIRLEPVAYRDIENHIIRGFYVSGKVIEKEYIREVCTTLRSNIFYINHFAAICDGLTRGFVSAPVVQQSMLSLVAMHEPRFIATMNGLTNFQVSLLRAILDGETKFSSSEVISRYGLNSSANVGRLKDALAKKEIVTFRPDGSAIILDPLFEYWVRTVFFA